MRLPTDRVYDPGIVVSRGLDLEERIMISEQDRKALDSIMERIKLLTTQQRTWLRRELRCLLEAELPPLKASDNPHVAEPPYPGVASRVCPEHFLYYADRCPECGAQQELLLGVTGPEKEEPEPWTPGRKWI